jgi:ABC-2 type transport system permease protein
VNVFWQELKMLRGSFVVWLCAFIGIATIYISVYPAFAHDTEVVMNAFAKLPDAIKQAMGTGGFAVLTFPGFIANVLPILLLAGGMQAMNMGITLANREKLAQTTDFLLTRPVSRARVFSAKLLAHLVVIATTGVLLTWYIYASARFAGAEEFSLHTFLMIMAVFSGIQAWFLAVGMSISALVGRIRSLVAVSMAVVFGLFIFGMFGSVIGDETIRYVTPFKYVDLLRVVTDQSYDTMHLVVWASIVVIGIALSWTLYVRKDVRA